MAGIPHEPEAAGLSRWSIHTLNCQAGAWLIRIRFDDEVLAWVSQAPRVSHGDEKQHHTDAIRRIQVGYDRLQHRIDVMCVDKLDGRIDTDFFDRMAAEWREEQWKCLALIREHQEANQT